MDENKITPELLYRFLVLNILVKAGGSAEKRQLLQNLQNLEEKSTIEEVPNYQCLSSGNSIGHCLEERIKLFRNLFRGREDVYARLWVSKKTGKSGYAPVCKNEWKPKICQKPVAKCYECPNRELFPLDDDVVCKHLKGESVIGIYPMMQDETCHFLAVDFDKEGWRDNVLAFKETCMQQGVSIAIERSRSGNGAHAWIFFEQNVPTMIARKMGSFLITETMSKRYQQTYNHSSFWEPRHTFRKGLEKTISWYPYVETLRRDAFSQGIHQNTFNLYK